MIALHAWRSAEAIQKFANYFPEYMGENEEKCFVTIFLDKSGPVIDSFSTITTPIGKMTLPKSLEIGDDLL